MKAEESMEDYFGNGFCGNLQHKLWNLLENPNSSFAAKIVAVVSCLFVVASTLSLIISTLPMFQIPKNEDDDDLSINETSSLEGGVKKRNNDGRQDDEEHFIFAVAEAISVGWFTFEYIIRYIAAPQKWRFIKAGMNIIDLLGVLPYYMSLGLKL